MLTNTSMHGYQITPATLYSTSPFFGVLTFISPRNVLPIINVLALPAAREIGPVGRRANNRSKILNQMDTIRLNVFSTSQNPAGDRSQNPTISRATATNEL